MTGSQPKILFWDIEATNLVANIGNILCIGYKILGEKTKVLSVRNYKGFKADPTDDKRLVKDFAEILTSCDMMVTWYGKKFDLPFLSSRLLYHGLKPTPSIPHFDGWYVAKYRLRLHSNRLASVQDFLELPSAKTPLSFRELSRSRAGHVPSLKSIEHHCYMDVEVLEQAYHKLKPYAGAYHPNLAALGYERNICPACGGKRIQSRGFMVAQTRVYRRHQCVECGNWFRSTQSERHMTAQVR